MPLQLLFLSCKVAGMKINTRQDVFDIFGGSAAAGIALDITQQAMYQWPEPLEDKQIDRVVGAAVRLGLMTGCRKINKRKVS